MRKIVIPRWRRSSMSVVHVSGCGRVEAGRGLIQEQHFRFAQQGPGERDPLAQTLWTALRRDRWPDRRRSTALKAPLDAVPRVGHLVQVSEAEQVVFHAEPKVQPRHLRHDGDALADPGAVVRVSGMPATVAEPDVGIIRVPRVRTVVVLPAPFGPRKPNISARSTSNDTFWKAIRSPKCLLRPLTESAGAPAGWPSVGSGVKNTVPRRSAHPWGLPSNVISL